MNKIVTALVALSLSCSLFAAKLDIQQWQTKNGAKVIFVEASQVPILDIKIAFKAGSAYDGKLHGLSALTTDLLNQGTKQLNATQVAELFEDVGAQYSANTTRDMAVFSLRTLTEPNALNKALHAFELVLSQPKFDSKAVAREKQQQISAIIQAQESPNDVASIDFFKSLYGTHPYAHPILGQKQTVPAITQKDIKAFYARYWVAANANIAIVGNINKQQAMQISEALMKNLAKGVPATAIEKAKPLTQAINKKITFPSSQTVFNIGQMGITHQTPEYFPLMVGNYTLGGGSLVSQLAIEVREKRGLTYGVYSYFSPMPGVGPFLISLATKTAQATEALTLTNKILVDFVANGPSQQELISAKKYMTGSFPLSLDSNKKIAVMLLKMLFYQLPQDFLDTYVNKVNNVTQEQIKVAFAKHIDPKKLLTVRVGKTKP